MTARGRIKIGSKFLKIGAKYVRIGPLLPAICDDFESGLGEWTFEVFGNSTYDLGAINPPVSPTHNLQIHIHNNPAADSIHFYRNISPAALGSDVIQLQYWVFPGDAADWDILFDDGSGNTYKFYPFGSTLWVGSTPSDVDTGMPYFDGSQFSQFTLKVNRALGEYVSVETTATGGHSADLTGVPATGVPGGPVIQPVFRLFSPGAPGPDHELYETDYDNICVGDA